MVNEKWWLQKPEDKDPPSWKATTPKENRPRSYFKPIRLSSTRPYPSNSTSNHGKPAKEKEKNSKSYQAQNIRPPWDSSIATPLTPPRPQDPAPKPKRQLPGLQNLQQVKESSSPENPSPPPTKSFLTSPVYPRSREKSRRALSTAGGTNYSPIVYSCFPTATTQPADTLKNSRIRKRSIENRNFSSFKRIPQFSRRYSQDSEKSETTAAVQLPPALKPPQISQSYSNFINSKVQVSSFQRDSTIESRSRSPSPTPSTNVKPKRLNFRRVGAGPESGPGPRPQILPSPEPLQQNRSSNRQRNPGKNLVVQVPVPKKIDRVKNTTPSNTVRTVLDTLDNEGVDQNEATSPVKPPVKKSKVKQASEAKVKVKVGFKGEKAPREIIVETFSRVLDKETREPEEIQRLETAIKEGKVFEIRGYNVNPAVRETLISRGWVEKIRPPKPVAATAKPKTAVVKKTEPDQDIITDYTNWSLARKMLNRKPANFIWADWTHKICWPLALDHQIVNRHPQDGFTLKVEIYFAVKLKKNLTEPMRLLHWVGREPKTSTCTSAFPRSYRLFVDEEKLAFIKDYRLTACMALLKWFVTSVEAMQHSSMTKTGVASVASLDNDLDPNTATSLLNLVDFATEQVRHYVRVRKHEDIDDLDGAVSEETIDEQMRAPSEIVNKIKEDDDHSLTSLTQHPSINKNVLLGNKDEDKNQRSEVEMGGDKNEVQTAGSDLREIKARMNLALKWETFLNRSYQITHQKANSYEVKMTSKGGAIEEGIKYMEAKRALEEVKPFWPQFDMEGMRNVWIVKPGDGTQGQDIIVLDKPDDLATRFFNADTSCSLWMSQKYIERPLLIYNTKFDIRQWFLISSWNPLIVWMYKKCYLRFSTQLFTLDDLSASIHLTNRHVQQKYRSQIDPRRDSSIPPDSMWSSATFIAYLKTIGKPNVWSKVIYSGMKKAIMAILLATRESIIHRPGSFHIHGADFMLSDDFRPWLIEINSNLVYANSTSVTAVMCPQCIKDAIKVVLDWDGGANPNADTGDFELLYQAQSKLPSSRDLPASNPESLESKNVIVQGQRVPSMFFIPQSGQAPKSSQQLDLESREQIGQYYDGNGTNNKHRSIIS